jgi:type IV pilus assembly protein PilB
MNEPFEALSRSASDAAALDALIAEARKRRVPVWDLAAADPRFSDDAIADAFARLSGAARVRIAALTVEPEALAAVPEKVARRHLLLPVTLDQRALVAAMANPLDFGAVEDVEFASSLKLKPVVASRAEILDAIARHYTPDDQLRDFVANVAVTDEFRVLRYDASGNASTDDQAGATHGFESTPVVKLCNLMLYDAIKAGASDIHVEPALNEVEVRMRVDGALRPYTRFPKWLHEPVVSRLKILARLDIAERRVPQDGRIGVRLQARTLDLRVSTLPTHFGEKVVLRVLGGGRTPAVTEIVTNDAHRASLERALGQTQGMILVTGPTGSGKTTTLYALLARRRTADLNIVTIEDPIEYQLDGITQVQVNVKAGLTFEATLRSILRQDPDVILVGEIRDGKTAETAAQAAMTGHLVLSSLHTNGAIATISRLLDLGVDPMVVGSSLSVVVAQRLVRRICERCREAYTPEADAVRALGLRAVRAFSRGRGCPACGDTGYAGRVALMEVLPITPDIKALIQRRATENEMQQAAQRSGTRSLLDSGVDLIRAGVTTVEEVFRMVGGAAEDAAAMPCPHCRAPIQPDFAICPYCRHTLKKMCEACGQELDANWQICPYCRHDQQIPAAKPAAARALSAPVKHPRILVVDDDALIRRAVSTALTQLEVQPQIRTASNGHEALASVEQEIPDLVVLDVMMPGMDGFEVCERLRQNLRTAFVPILMLTRNSDEAHRTKGFVVGTDDFMAKPFSVPELTARVTRLLRRTYGL